MGDQRSLTVVYELFLQKDTSFPKMVVQCFWAKVPNKHRRRHNILNEATENKTAAATDDKITMTIEEFLKMTKSDFAKMNRPIELIGMVTR